MTDVISKIKDDHKFSSFLEAAPDAIVVANHEGRIVMVNKFAEKIFSYNREEILGQKIELLVPDRFRLWHETHRGEFSEAHHSCPMNAGEELSGRRKDGSEFPIEISISSLNTEKEELIISIIRDITDRRRTEEQIKSNLREKEVLLKEIHHRVKNNLQVTSSLLRLQSEFIQDKQARMLFSESQNRIRSMALVHEKLYQSSDLSRINFYEYADTLTQLLFRSYGVDTKFITWTMEGCPVYMSVEFAVPCGLIINELLSNCLKHAFPDRAGNVAIVIRDNIINISDNGVGLVKGFNFETTETLGLQLVRTLAKQLKATVTVKSEKGTAFQIYVPDANS